MSRVEYESEAESHEPTSEESEAESESMSSGAEPPKKKPKINKGIVTHKKIFSFRKKNPQWAGIYLTACYSYE